MSPATSARRGDDSCVPPAAFRAVLLSLKTGGLTGAERAKVKADEKTDAKAAEDKKAAQEMADEVGIKKGHICIVGLYQNCRRMGTIVVEVVQGILRSVPTDKYVVFHAWCQWVNARKARVCVGGSN